MKLKLTFKRAVGAMLLLCCLLLAVPLLCGRSLRVTLSGRYYILAWTGLDNMDFTASIRYGPDGREVDRTRGLGPVVLLYGKQRTN